MPSRKIKRSSGPDAPPWSPQRRIPNNPFDDPNRVSKEIRAMAYARLAAAQKHGAGIIQISIPEARILIGENCQYCMGHIADAEAHGHKSMLYNTKNFHVLSQAEAESSRLTGRI